MPVISIRFVATILALWTGVARAEFNPCPQRSRPDSPPAKLPSNALDLSPYTYHWTASETARKIERDRPVFLIGYEHFLPDGRLCGASYFRNSYGQPSGFVFVGKAWDHPWARVQRLSLAIRAGALIGYVSIARHAVPFNYHGVSPGLIPDVGWAVTSTASVHLYTLSTTGVMLGYTQRY